MGYSPYAGIELAGHAGDSNSLHEPGTAAPMETILRNNLAQPANLTLVATVLGPGYQRVAISQRTVVVPPASSIFTAHSVPSALLGPHRVYLTATEGNTQTEVASDHFSFGILADARRSTPNSRSRFGVNMEFSPNFTHSLRLAQRAGFGRW